MTAPANLTIEQYNEQKQDFIKQGFFFSEVVNMSGKYLKFGGLRMYCNKVLEVPQNELWIFKKVQSEADTFIAKEENQHIKSLYIPIQTQLCNLDPAKAYDKNFLEKYANVVQIDISSAYAHAAYKIGFISKKTLGILLSMHKATRLAAIGSIAASKKVQYYQDGKLVLFDSWNEKKNEYEKIDTLFIEKETRNLFFLAAKKIEETILPIMHKQHEVFFCWVDAIVCPAELRPAVCHALKKANYPYKVDENMTLTIKSKLEDNFPTIYYMLKPPPMAETEIQLKMIEKKLSRREVLYKNRTKVYPFSLRNTGKFFNEMASKERALYESLTNKPFEELKNDFTESLIETYGTSNIAHIPIEKVLSYIGKYGLDASDLLHVEKRAKSIFSKYEMDTQSGDWIKTFSYSILTEWTKKVSTFSLKIENTDTYIYRSDIKGWEKEEEELQYILMLRQKVRKQNLVINENKDVPF